MIMASPPATPDAYFSREMHWAVSHETAPRQSRAGVLAWKWLKHSDNEADVNSLICTGMDWRPQRLDKSWLMKFSPMLGIGTGPGAEHCSG